MFADREHIGQVVLHIPQNLSAISSVRSGFDLTLNPKASHLLARAIGGPSRSIATWMVQHGARSDLICILMHDSRHKLQAKLLDKGS